MDNTVIKAIKQHPHFEEYLSFMQSILAELDFPPENIKLIDNQRLGEIMRAKAEAKETLYKMLAPLIEFSEKKEPTTEDVQRAKNKFGLS